MLDTKRIQPHREPLGEKPPAAPRAVHEACWMCGRELDGRESRFHQDMCRDCEHDEFGSDR